jgi:hypothetical protein
MTLKSCKEEYPQVPTVYGPQTRWYDSGSYFDPLVLIQVVINFGSMQRPHRE